MGSHFVRLAIVFVTVGFLANQSYARLLIDDPLVGNFSIETSQLYWKGKYFFYYKKNSSASKAFHTNITF